MAKFNPSIIREERERRHMSAADLGEILGVSRSHISYIETGKRPVSPKLALRLEKALGIPKETIHPHLWAI